MPLVVRGARGVGKTYAVINFAAGCGRPYLYVNFETDGAARQLFEDESLEIDGAVASYFGIEKEALGRFLIIFDEHQACNRDLTHVEALISEYSAKIIYLSSFDVKHDYGAFETIIMKPLRFREFLDMIGKTWYREVLEAHYEKMKPVPAIVNQEITDLFFEYLRVGGMPGVIKSYIESDTDSDVLESQISVCRLIKLDILKYGGNNSNIMSQIFEAVPAHTAAGKPHFMPGLIRRGLTVSNIREGIETLIENGIVYRMFRASVNCEEFRLGMEDCGLFRSMIYANYALRGERLDRELTASVIAAGLCDRGEAKYLRSNGSILNAFLFSDRNDNKTAIDISGTYLRYSTVNASIGALSERPRIIRLNDDNFRTLGEEIILPTYVYELL